MLGWRKSLLWNRLFQNIRILHAFARHYCNTKRTFRSVFPKFSSDKMALCNNNDQTWFFEHSHLLYPSWVVKTLPFHWFSCKAWNIDIHNVRLFVQRRIHGSRRGDSDKLGRGSICRWSLIFLEYPYKNEIICSEPLLDPPLFATALGNSNCPLKE